MQKQQVYYWVYRMIHAKMGLSLREVVDLASIWGGNPNPVMMGILKCLNDLRVIPLKFNRKTTTYHAEVSY